jgi:hypothetical protein
MTASTITAAPETPPTEEPAKPRRPLLTFTDPGCRWELRLGLLLVLAASFLWAWLGPMWAKDVLIIGVPLVLVGAILQAWQARSGRPGYPLKLALFLVAIGVVMCFDLSYRESVGDRWRVAPPPAIIAGTGLWLLLLYPVARIGVRQGEVGSGS